MLFRMDPPTAPVAIFTRSELEAMEIDVLDHMAFGVIGGQQVVLLPSQIKIRYHDDLINPQAKFNAQGMEWAQSVDLSTPIEVSVDDAGDFYLEDGHHRWFSAGKTGRSLTATLEIKGKPIEKILALQSAAAATEADQPARRVRRSAP